MQLIARPMDCCMALVAKDLNVISVIYPAMLLFKDMMGLQ